MKRYSGNIVDIINRRIIKGEIIVENGIIKDIIEKEINNKHFIIPGLVDAHMHIESTMLIPSEFAKIAVKNGTVAVVADPHEIANVMGTEGIEFMINNSKKTPLKVCYCVPSCVPATDFESSGAKIDAEETEKIFQKNKLTVLAEMMNYPGVLNNDKEVIAKIKIAKKFNAKIDGHSPGLFGKDLQKYVSAGISTDHECFTIEEALEKIKLGMKVLIREGSAARNFESLYPLITMFNSSVMLCTDDSHPDDLLKYGHINKILKLGIKKGLDIFDLLTVACLNPKIHYNLNIGLLQLNDPADFVIVDNLTDFNISETVIDGEIVYSNNRVLFTTEEEKPINNFKAEKISQDDIKIKAKSNSIKVIEVIDKELITNQFNTTPKVINDNIVSDTEKDILKIVVYNRYTKKSSPSIGFINGFGLLKGAIATSIAHDSHNIIAVGCSDEDIVNAINEIIDHKGGLTYCLDKDFYSIGLEFAGLMTQSDIIDVAKKYEKINKACLENGCKLSSPFMTLSFMSLLVIPDLKIGDKGLFDVTYFKFTDLFN